MKKLLILTLVLITSFIGAMQSSAQNCGDPVSIMSAYYSYEPHTKFGIGFEAGSQGVDSRLGYYAGIRLTMLKQPEYTKQDSAMLDYRLAFYLKGTVRLSSFDSKGSLYVVAAPQMSLQAGFDVQSGLRFMYPLSGKKGIGLEPLYSVRQKNVALNFILAF
jgi:hypothetical protein